MSFARTARALPTLLRVGFAEALAYRAEMLVWILSTTMPLVMLALWHAVAREAPVGRFDQGDLVAYFLAMFVVRQLTGSWSVWVFNMEVREGTLAIGLLALLVESSTKVMDVWLAAYFVFSGYMIPIELFPRWLRGIVEIMPFRYQLGLPVEIMTGAHGRLESLVLLAQQGLVVLAAGALVALVWRLGLRRFAAYGG